MGALSLQGGNFDGQYVLLGANAPYYVVVTYEEQATILQRI